MIPILIQAAVQAALGAIQVLRELGYLKPDDAQQVVLTLMNGQVPDDKPDTMAIAVASSSLRMIRMIPITTKNSTASTNPIIEVSFPGRSPYGLSL